MSKIRIKQIDLVELSGYINQVNSGDVASLEESILTLESGVSELNNNYSDLIFDFNLISGQNDGVSSRLDAIESTFSDSTNEISVLSGEILSLKSATGILQDDLSVALDSISIIESGVSGISGVTDNYVYNYIYLADVKNSGVGGGTFSGGSWITRDINTEISDSGSLCSISANVITLQDGLYSCNISCPAIGVGSHMSRLYNNSDSSVLLSGTMEYAGNFSSRSNIIGRFSIAGGTGKLISIQHLCQSTVIGSGFGSGSSLNDSDLNNIYTIAEFSKIL